MEKQCVMKEGMRKGRFIIAERISNSRDPERLLEKAVHDSVCDTVQSIVTFPSTRLPCPSLRSTTRGMQIQPFFPRGNLLCYVLCKGKRKVLPQFQWKYMDHCSPSNQGDLRPAWHSIHADVKIDHGDVKIGRRSP